MPDHQAVRRFYDDKYYAGAGHTGVVAWHMRRVASRLGITAATNALDVACGAGAWLAELHRRGATVSGTDISARAVERAKAWLAGADIRESVAEQLPFEAAQFDLITCMGSLEHFLDQPKALQEMRRVGKPDAKFLILVPNAGFLTRRFGLYGGTQQTAIRETVRPIAEWESMFQNAGLRVQAKWRDLHPLSRGWVCRGPAWKWGLRLAQACALACWPVAWQYQVYFLCRVAPA